MTKVMVIAGRGAVHLELGLGLRLPCRGSFGRVTVSRQAVLVGLAASRIKVTKRSKRAEEIERA